MDWTGALAFGLELNLRHGRDPGQAEYLPAGGGARLDRQRDSGGVSRPGPIPGPRRSSLPTAPFYARRALREEDCLYILRCCAKLCP